MTGLDILWSVVWILGLDLAIYGLHGLWFIVCYIFNILRDYPVEAPKYKGVLLTPWQPCDWWRTWSWDGENFEVFAHCRALVYQPISPTERAAFLQEARVTLLPDPLLDLVCSYFFSPIREGFQSPPSTSWTTLWYSGKTLGLNWMSHVFDGIYGTFYYRPVLQLSRWGLCAIAVYYGELI